MFRINSLPATIGDSILIEYGEGQAIHSVLIDGGTSGTYTHLKKALKEKKGKLELVVVSHIDNDHIAGILKLLEEEAIAPSDQKLGLTFGDFWFNGWPQLNNRSSAGTNIEIYGVEQGERLTEQIRYHKFPWNSLFDQKAIVVADNGRLPQRRLPGGMLLTVLSPLADDLTKMKDIWEEELLKAGLISGLVRSPENVIEGVERFGTLSTGLFDIDELASSKFVGDRSMANRSSIALVAEYEGKSVLLAADAHADVLLSSLHNYQPNGKPRFDLFKVSHHGARGTTSLDLVKAVDCKRYLFSTNSAGYHHPHPEAISRVIKAAGGNLELIFNYKTADNRAWEDIARVLSVDQLRATYPQDDENGITVDV